MMKIYDKASWHLDAGEDNEKVIARFKTVMTFLKEKDLLTSEGLEIYALGIDSSFSLHERMLTNQGQILLDRCYDKCIEFEPDKITEILNAFWIVSNFEQP